VPQVTTLNGLAAADGAYITLAFVTDDVSGSGARPELALDNIRVTARAAGAAVLTVDDDGGADYTSIQAAIDAAGAGAEIEVSGGPFDEKVTINTENITLRGVSDGTGGSAVASKAAPSGAPVINGQVIVSASGAVLDGFIVSPSPATTNPEGEAIRIDSGADNVIIRNNTVQNFTEGGLSEDIEGIVAFGGSGDPVQSPEITNNLVQDITRSSSVSGGAVGISIQGNVQNASVSGNTVRRISDGTAPYGFGIVVRGSGNSGGPPTGVSVTNNTITSIISDGTFFGVGFGVETDSEGNPSISTVTGNVLSNTEVQAEDKTYNLDLNAFIANNTLDRAAVIRDGSGVKNETFAQRVYSTISAPVGRAATGETVEAFAGTYVEQVVISTDNLTLIGAGAGSTTIQSPDEVLTSIGGTAPLQPVLGVNEETGVTIQNLTVDGAGQGNAQGGGFAGIGFANAGGTVTDVTVIGVRNDPFSGAQRGTGIRAENRDGTARSITITNTSVSDFQKNGVTLQGPGLTVDVSNNTVTGRGATSALAQNGIEVDDGASGSVSGNTVTGIYYSGSSPNIAAAAIIYNATGSVTDNSISGSQAGVFAISPGATFDRNSIEVPAANPNITYGIIALATASTKSKREGQRASASRPVQADLSYGHTRSSVITAKSSSAFTFTNNAITGNGDGYGLFLQSNDTVASFTGNGNLISSLGSGIFLFIGTGDVQSAIFTENCILNNQNFGVENALQSPTVNATDNWWGSAAGPGTGGANGVDGPVDAEPFATDPVSGVEGCGGATDECKPSKFEEIIVSNQPPGEVKITINDTEGIDQVRFYEVSNFTIASEQGDFDDPDDDGIWTPSGSSTSTTFMLTQADTDNPDASYFAQITNGCGTLTDIDPPHGFDVAPVSFALEGNYPNPFRTQTTLQFDLPEPVDVTLSVYDVMGRRVATLVDQPMQAGAHEVRWDGRSASGSTVASGVYLLRLEAGERVATQRMTVVK
jgi:hypothetical protein